MPERREPRCDGAAWVLLLCGLLVALCVYSDDPAGALPNLLGPPGTWLARELVLALGSAVHVLLASWLVLVVMLLVRKSWWRWTGRLLGWLILLPCAALGADWLGPQWIGGPVPGSGGTIGAWLHGLLAEALPPPWAALALGGASVVGIFLAADIVVRYVCVVLYHCCLALSWIFATMAGRAEALGAPSAAAKRRKLNRVRKFPIFPSCIHAGTTTMPPRNQPSRLRPPRQPNRRKRRRSPTRRRVSCRLCARRRCRWRTSTRSRTTSCRR